MRSHTITVLPGDGIGPEVMGAAMAVLLAAGERFGFKLVVRPGLIGQAALDENGRVLPVETLQHAKESQAVFVGPIVGDPNVDVNAVNHPKQGLVKLRAWLGSFATVRPIRTYASTRSMSALAAGCELLDVLVVYDHSSGLFYGQPHGIDVREDGSRLATNTMVYTTGEISRTARVAFELAQKRQKRVLSVDRAKMLETGQLWSETLLDVAVDYPDVTLTRRDAQHFFYELPRRVTELDVLVSEMSLGHLIASAVMGLTGTFALHAAAYVGGAVPLFQPSHGAAPLLAGQGTADPVGAIRAAALMLSLGLGEVEAAAAIEAAVESALFHGELPPDLIPDAQTTGGFLKRGLGTAAMGQAVLDRLVQPTVQRAG